MSSARTPGRRRTFPAWTDERAQEIIKYLSEGQNRETCAELVGINPSTLRLWFAWGDGRTPGGVRPPGDGSFDRYVAFLAEAKKAERRAIAVAVDAIRKAGEKNWCAWAWILERMHPDQFSDNRKLLKELQFALSQVEKLAAEQAAELVRLRGERADNQGNPGSNESPIGTHGSRSSDLTDDANAGDGSDHPSIR